MSEPPPSEPTQGFLRKHGGKLVLSLMLGFGLAWLLVQGKLPILPSQAALANVRWSAVVLYVASLVIVHVLRAIRWRHLLRPVGHVSTKNVLLVSWIGFGAILLWPLRSGEFVRPYLVTKRGSVRLWEATGTVGAERVVDGLVLASVLFAGLKLARPLDPLPDHVGDLPVPAAAVPGAAYGALLLFALAFAVMTVFYAARAPARRVTIAVIGVVSHNLADRVAGIVERVADGLRFLPAPRLLLPFMAETLSYWAVNVLGVWMLLWAVGLPDPTVAEACVVVGCLGIGILLPAGPAYVGVFQLSTYMALAMFFPASAVLAAGSAFVFLLYVTQVGCHIAATAVALLLDRDAEKLALASPEA